MSRRRLSWLMLSFFFVVSPVSGAIIHVPGDQPTIQLGISAAAPGDTVLVACGRYQEHDLLLPSGICLRSETGQPECATIDAGQQGRVLRCIDASPQTRIEGFTITGGSVNQDNGGGIHCLRSSPTILRCIFTGNLASAGGSAIYCDHSNPLIRECRISGNLRSIDGGGLYCTNSSPTVSDCVFSGNSALFWGGAVFCSVSSPHLVRCTLVGNAAHAEGGGIWCVYDSHPILEDTIIASCPDGEGVFVYSNPGHQSVVSLTCCDVFGNVDGNYGGVIEDPTGHDGNISADPLFCDAAAGDFHVASSSPCLPPNNSCGVQMGALGEGCSFPAAVEGVGPLDSPNLVHVSNPFVRGGEIGLSLSAPADVSLSIYDCSGRRVARLMAATRLSAGPHTVRWDGMDDRGAALAPGVYFCRLATMGDSEITRIMLIR